MAQLPSDAELREAIAALVPTVDLETTGLKKFVKLLGRELGCDALFPKKEFIKSELTKAIHRLQDQQEEQGSGDGSASEADDDPDASEVEDERERVAIVTPPKSQSKTKSTNFSSSSKSAGSKASSGGGGGGGLSAPKEISPALAAFLGQGPTMARKDIVKALWEYIREHDLQNPANKREIVLDGPLRKVFGCDTFTMFTMNKYIGAHVHPFKPVDLSTSSSPGSANKKRTASTSKRNKAAKKPRKTGAQPPYRLSDDLRAVVGADVLPRPQVVSRLWDYIKSNGLQNPNDKREILCDDALRRVMGNKSKVTMFNMNQHLTPHLLEKVDRGEYANVVADDDGEDEEEEVEEEDVEEEDSD